MSREKASLALIVRAIIVDAGKRKALSYAEHIDLGARVKEARELLLDVRLRVAKGFGTSSKASKIVGQILEKFDSGLKNELDNLVFRDFPEKETKELTRVYYGSITRSKVVLHRSRKPD